MTDLAYASECPVDIQGIEDHWSETSTEEGKRKRMGSQLLFPRVPACRRAWRQTGKAGFGTFWGNAKKYKYIEVEMGQWIAWWPILK